MIPKERIKLSKTLIFFQKILEDGADLVKDITWSFITIDLMNFCIFLKLLKYRKSFSIVCV